MSLLDEYENRYETPRLDIAKNILFTIADDIFGRSGFDWDEIINDPETKEELLETNLDKINNILSQTNDR